MEDQYKPAKFLKFLNKAIFVLILLYVISSSISIAASEGFLFLALVAWVIKVIIDKKRKEIFFFSGLDIPVIAFFIMRILSTISGIDPANSMAKMKELLLFITIYLVRFSLDRDQFVKLLKVLVYSTSIGAVARIIHMYIIQGQPFDLEHRLNGFTGGYMTYGSIIAISLIIGFCLLFFNKVSKKEKVFLFISLGFLVIAEGMTMTRSAWMGLIVAMLFLGIFRNRILLAAVVVVITAGIILAPGKIRKRAFSMFTSDDLTTYTRLKMWNWGFKVAKDHPVVGIGPNNINKLKLTGWREYPLEDMVQEDMVHQHNNFMQYLVTLGIPGLLIFIWLIAMVFKLLISTLLKYKQDPKYSGALWGVLAVFIAFNVTGLFEYNFLDSEIILIIFFLIGGVQTFRKKCAGLLF